MNYKMDDLLNELRDDLNLLMTALEECNIDSEAMTEDVWGTFARLDKAIEEAEFVESQD